MKLRDLAEAIDARLVGDGSLDIERPVHPAEADRPTDLALAMEPSTVRLLKGSTARAAVVAEGAEVPDGMLQGYIVVSRPRYAMAGLMDIFERPLHAPRGVHPSAVVEADARLAEGVAVGAFAYVGGGAEIGTDTVLMDHVSVGAEARVGRDCLFHAGVRIGERVVVGDRVIIQHNASIGSDGFSYVTPQMGSVESAKATGRVEATNTDIVRINSIGTVVLEDDVEVGACSAIDRGTVAATVVGRNTKIDNLVMIGHNCVIGENCFICGQVGVGGSCTIGDRVVLAGQVGVADHVTIGSDAIVAGGSGVGRNVAPKSILLGYPAIPRERALEQYVYLNRLKSLFNDVSELKHSIKGTGTSDRDG